MVSVRSVDREHEEQPSERALGLSPLSLEACRVLGSLLEKELTVPSTYPMTLNGLVTACNQASGRNPVMALSEADVARALDELRSRGLTRVVHASHGARTTKYRQVAHEVLSLGPPERAVITQLLLRGAQTPGELRTRSERLHRFGSVDEVSQALVDLSSRSPGLAVEQARRAGHKEARWAHLLAGEPATADDGPAQAPGGGSFPSGSAPGLIEPVDLHPQAEPLRAFVGRWEGAGAGEYPTIEPFTYVEEIVIAPVAGKPLLSYRSGTRHPSTGAPMHAESGWLRPVGDDVVELVVAQGPGLVEVAEGLFEADDHGGELVLESTLLAGTTTAKQVTAVERRYRVSGDRLEYDLAMAAVGLPMTHHLRAALHRA